MASYLRLIRKVAVTILLFLVTTFFLLDANESFADFENEVNSSLQGRITDENGKPIEGATVKVGAYAPIPGERFRFLASATTDNTGVYSIPSYTRVRGEPLTAVIESNGYLIGYTLRSYDDTLNFQMPRERTKLNGNGIPGEEVTLFMYLGGSRGWIEVAATTVGSNGRFALSIIPGDFVSYYGTDNQFFLNFGDHILWPEPIILYLGETVHHIRPGFSNPPTVTATPDRSPNAGGWYNGDVLITFQTEHFDNPFVHVDPPFLVATEGINQIIEGLAVDSTGLMGTALISINIDKTTPVTTASVMETPNQHGWYNTDVDVILNANDNLSGVEQTQFSYNNGENWILYNGTINISEEGKHNILYRSVDKAGNIESTRSLEVYIDKTPPELLIMLDKNVLFPPNKKMVDVNATIVGNDTSSGIDTIVLLSIESSESYNGIGDGNITSDIRNADYGTLDTTYSLRAERSGKGEGRVYTITYLAIDRAGNKTKKSEVVLVPKNQNAPN